MIYPLFPVHNLILFFFHDEIINAYYLHRFYSIDVIQSTYSSFSSYQFPISGCALVEIHLFLLFLFLWLALPKDEFGDLKPDKEFCRNQVQMLLGMSHPGIVSDVCHVGHRYAYPIRMGDCRGVKRRKFVKAERRRTRRTRKRVRHGFDSFFDRGDPVK